MDNPPPKLDQVTQLQMMIAYMCDAIKRLEKAILTSDASERERYLEECKEKREFVESKLLPP